MISRQFLMFLCTGGVAAAVNFGSCIILNQMMTFSSAIIVAYLFGMCTAFILAKLFVFKKSTHSTLKSACYFVIVNGFAIFQTWSITLVLAYYVLPAIGVSNYVDEMSHFVGVVFPVFTSFAGHKYFSFRE